jgi:hypothetical protein
MDMATFIRESALNRQAYGASRDEIRRDYAGKYVLLANGKVVGADASFDAACALANSLDPVPEYLVFHADAEPDFGLGYDLWEAA